MREEKGNFSFVQHRLHVRAYQFHPCQEYSQSSTYPETVIQNENYNAIVGQEVSEL